MQSRQLKYFLAVAERGSIAAASRTLNIAQPALSRQISGLEQELGHQLFDRMPRGVRLTRAGRELVRHSRRILEDIGDIGLHIDAAAKGRTGTIRVGVTPNQSANPRLTNAIKIFSRELPNVTVIVIPMASDRQEAALRDGSLDAGLIVWRSPLDARLTGQFVQRDHMGIAVPHAIAQELGPNPTLEDFASQKFVVYDRDRFPALQDSISRALKGAGIRPLETPLAADFQALLGFVYAGIGCAIVPASYASLCPPGVSILSVSGLDIVYNIEIVHSAVNNDPTVHRFVEAVVQRPDTGLGIGGA